ncbi:MAG TPA: response regulator transcription factor [Chloroflexota bacterium]|nr:response regulator transcription factor [Chloroflexota bacterium]
METVRVLVVDDEETIRDLIEMGLRYEGYEVQAVADGEAALAAVQRWRPHLVILDRMLPGMDGLEVCRWLRAKSDVLVLMLTARGEVDDRVEGLESGADDYLPKPFKFKELLARMRAVLRRHDVSVGRVLYVADLRLDREAREVTRTGRVIELTPKEFDILELLVAHPRQVFSRETILNRVWGYDYVGDTKLIDVHISALRAKLGDEDRSLIRTVRGVGYSLRA